MIVISAFYFTPSYIFYISPITESVGRLVLQHQFDHVRPAKQTRTNFRIPSVILDVPKVGYLKNSGVLAVDTFGPGPSTPSTSQVVRQKRNTTHTGKNLPFYKVSVLSDLKRSFQYDISFNTTDAD